ncbi:MAG: EI24 domain-containing protein [Bdellovibrionia bacterium]
MISRFVKGFRSPFDGFRLIVSNASFWRLATIPYIIDLILFCVGVYFGITTIPGMMPAFIAGGSWWGPILYYPMLVFSVLAYVVLLFTALFFLTNLIAAPFNTLLAEKTLTHIGHLKPKNFEVVKWLKVSSRMLTVSLLRAVVFICLAVVLFFVSLIPGLNILTAYAGVLLMSFDCADFAFEAQEKTLKERFGHYRSHLAEFSGFGCALGLTFLIPGLNLLLYPATVVGAALLVASFSQPTQGKSIDSRPRS